MGIRDMKRVLAALFVISVVCFTVAVGYFWGLRDGTEVGARQMARHILHPLFRTPSFDGIVQEEAPQRTSGTTDIDLEQDGIQIIAYPLHTELGWDKTKGVITVEKLME